MNTRKVTLFPVLFSIALLLSACNQQGKTPVAETPIPPISAVVNDSALFLIDKSPMDMIYFPVDYPKEKMVAPGLENPLARVIYSRPQKNGREIFADSSTTKNVIQHYGKEWRLGANEATEIEFFKPASVNGKKIAAGRYIMYCIPYPDKWKIIFNSNLFSWGLHMDKTKDVAEIELPVSKNNTPAEYFTMLFQKATNGCELQMEWGDFKVTMPVNFN